MHRSLAPRTVILTLLVALFVMPAGCKRERTWRRVTSATHVYTFDFPDGWRVEQTASNIVSYFNPETKGELTVSGYADGVSEDFVPQFLQDAWTAVAGKGVKAGPWKRSAHGNTSIWEQDYERDGMVTHIVVGWQFRQAALMTLTDTSKAAADNAALYRHIYDSLHVDIPMRPRP